jgi:hypothetical protein
MQIDHQILVDRIHLLTFDNQIDMTSTFLRFQEHYESPFFKGKYFTLDEFKEWYIKTSPNGKKSGKFTYYTDWGGFNIPSYILKPFFNGAFNPLSENEKQFLSYFENNESDFYIIGITKQTTSSQSAIVHETAHGLFYLNESYRKEIEQIISAYDVYKFNEKLIDMGYHQDVLVDEIQAYCIDSTFDMEQYFQLDMISEIQNTFRKYIQPTEL